MGAVMRNTRGFTLMELTIVLAVLAIVAAILVPTFLTTTDRARLRSDIQSAHVISNAMELYRAERGVSVTNGAADMGAVLTGLHTAGFLRDMRVGDAQTDGAVWSMNGGRVVVDISGSLSDAVHRAATNLTDTERAFIIGLRDV